MTLHDLIQTDAVSVFCNTDDFAEVATYFPRSGPSREIDVVIIRDSLAVLQEDGDAIIPFFEVHVANTSTRGISSVELNLGGDSIEFAIRVGQSKLTHRSITKLLSHDEGMLVLECR